MKNGSAGTEPHVQRAIQELDQADGGLSAKLRKTERLLGRLDPELASFLQQQDMQFELFALRWAL